MENLQELSKKTLGSYIHKALDRKRDNDEMAGQYYHEFITKGETKPGTRKGLIRMMNKSNKRTRGIKNATDKLTKEENMAENQEMTIEELLTQLGQMSEDEVDAILNELSEEDIQAISAFMAEEEEKENPSNDEIIAYGPRVLIDAVANGNMGEAVSAFDAILTAKVSDALARVEEQVTRNLVKDAGIENEITEEDVVEWIDSLSKEQVEDFKTFLEKNKIEIQDIEVPQIQKYIENAAKLTSEEIQDVQEAAKKHHGKHIGFNGLVAKLKKEGKSAAYAKKIAGKVYWEQQREETDYLKEDAGDGDPHMAFADITHHAQLLSNYAQSGFMRNQLTREDKNAIMKHHRAASKELENAASNIGSNTGVDHLNQASIHLTDGHNLYHQLKRIDYRTPGTTMGTANTFRSYP